MKKYITNLHGQSASSTAAVAQHMITSIAKTQGYGEISIRVHDTNLDTESEREKRIEGSLSALSKEDMVVVQLPSWNGIRFDECFLKILRNRVDKVVLFVHDFVPIMFVNNAYLFDAYLNAYNLADLVILPSKKMEHELRIKGLRCPVIIQELWDHVTDLEFSIIPTYKKVLKFAGSSTRFPFVSEWNSGTLLEVFSDGEPNSKENVKFKGWKTDDELLRELNTGGFGLVWSENIENQNERQYSEMNASFKFSTYLAAGLPLIVNKGLAKEGLVTKYGIGYAFDTLEEATEYIENITEETYESMQQNVKKISILVRDGFFTKQLLIEIQKKLYL